MKLGLKYFFEFVKVIESILKKFWNKSI